MELDDPARLPEAARICVIGMNLRLRDVQPAPTEDAGEQAGSAAAYADDEDQALLLLGARHGPECGNRMSTHDQRPRSRALETPMVRLSVSLAYRRAEAGDRCAGTAGRGR